MLRFAEVTGRAELWIDGRKVAAKDAAAPAPFEGPLPAGTGERRVVLLVEAAPGAASGITGGVTLTGR